MTLAETLLPKLSDWQPAGDGRHSWSDALPGGWTVHVAADKTDTLSCLVWELTLTRADAPPPGLTLDGWAAGIAARVTGLVEPLKLYEVDAARDEAVLRSDAPSTRAGKLAYYEVRLHGLTRAVVRRFHATMETPGREQVAFALTHEVLAKLAADLAG